MESDDEVWLESGSQEFADSDTEIGDEREHNRLLDAIRSLDGKKGRGSQRSEPAANVSEFNISSSAAGKVQVRELLGALKKSTAHAELKKQLRRVQKNNDTVKVPLSKPNQERIQRTIAYEKTKHEVTKWWPVVQQNRKADQLEFPLQQQKVKLITSKEFTSGWKPYTSLEKEVAKLLNQNHKSNLKESKELSKAEEETLAAMSLEEAKVRRAELQKHRMLLSSKESKARRLRDLEEAKRRRGELQKLRVVSSYKESKARRLKKIKSKNYHRIMRKERTKEEQKALEELEKTDPEGYEEKVDLMQRNRIQERMSLKHRGGSKFMQQKMIYAKYDNKARQDVQEMLQHSRDITKKLDSDDDDEEGEEEAVSMVTEEMEPSGGGPIETGSSNPWMVVSYGKSKAKEGTESSQQMEPQTHEGDENDTSLTSAELESNTESPLKHAKTEALTKHAKSAKLKSNSESPVKRTKTKALTKDTGDKLKPDSDSPIKHAKTKNSGDIVNDSEEVTDTSEDEELSVVKKISENIPDSIEKIFEVGLSKKAKKQKLKIKKKRQKLKKKRIAREKKEEGKSNEKNNKSKERKKDGKKKKKGGAYYKSSSSEELSDSDWESESEVPQLGNTEGATINQSLTRKRTLEDMDTANWSDDENEEVAAKVSKVTEKPAASKPWRTSGGAEEVHVDPKKFFTLEGATSIAGAASGELLTEGDTGIDNQQQRMTIMEAFASDDVIEEFSKEKKELMDRDKPKDIDLSLPGWGDWAGGGIKPSSNKKKKRKFLIKAPPGPPRKDKGMKNVIISETKDNTIAKHQVKKLPYPFNNVHEFEKSIRQPLGKTWNPETAFKSLVKPKVITKLGTVIEPMDKDNFKKKLGNEKPMNLQNAESKHGQDIKHNNAKGPKARAARKRKR